MEEVTTNPTKNHQNLHRTGETDSWRAQTKSCVHQYPGERSSDPTRDWPRHAMSVQESLAKVWVGGGRVRGTECNSACIRPFEGGFHYLHYLHYLQFILKEISPEYSLEELILKLKLQYFDHLMGRTDWLEKTLILGKIEGRRRGWVGWMSSLTQWWWVWINSRSWWWSGRPGVLQSIGSQRFGHDWATELSWTDLHYLHHSLASE